MLVRILINMNSPPCWWERKMVRAARWHILKKLNIILPYSPVVTFLGIYSIELKTYIHTKICTQILIATLFIITKN